MDNNLHPIVAEYIKFLTGLVNGPTIVSSRMMFDDNFAWMKFIIKYILKDSSDIIKFYSHLSETPEYNPYTGALSFKEWNGESTLILGCGHDMHRHGSDEYLIDVDLMMLPDLCLEACHQSLAKALPEAKGKIHKIVFEGWCGDETQVFVDDCLFLLDEGGYVVSGDSKTHQVIKRDDKLYFVKFGDDGYEESSVEYRPWVTDDITNGIFGFDIHDWKANMIRNGDRIKQLDKKRMNKEMILRFIESMCKHLRTLETAL